MDKLKVTKLANILLGVWLHLKIRKVTFENGAGTSKFKMATNVQYFVYM